MDYYSNVTNTDSNTNFDTYSTNVESSSDNFGDYDSTSTEELQEGEWVWIPKGYNPPGYYKPATYQSAQSRQGILSLVNAQQLV